MNGTWEQTKSGPAIANKEGARGCYLRRRARVREELPQQQPERPQVARLLRGEGVRCTRQVRSCRCRSCRALDPPVS